jgi:hypothetical protein
MPHEQIPDMLGRALSGTKYGVCQTRGKYGLGAKMALIWSKMTTGMPFEICSARPGKTFCSQYILDIDIHKNEPNVHSVKVQPVILISLILTGACAVDRNHTDSHCQVSFGFKKTQATTLHILPCAQAA